MLFTLLLIQGHLMNLTSLLRLNLITTNVKIVFLHRLAGHTLSLFIKNTLKCTRSIVRNFTYDRHDSSPIASTIRTSSNSYFRVTLNRGKPQILPQNPSRLLLNTLNHVNHDVLKHHFKLQYKTLLTAMNRHRRHKARGAVHRTMTLLMRIISNLIMLQYILSTARDLILRQVRHLTLKISKLGTLIHGRVRRLNVGHVSTISRLLGIIKGLLTTNVISHTLSVISRQRRHNSGLLNHTLTLNSTLINNTTARILPINLRANNTLHNILHLILNNLLDLYHDVRLVTRINGLLLNLLRLRLGIIINNFLANTSDNFRRLILNRHHLLIKVLCLILNDLNNQNLISLNVIYNLCKGLRILLLEIGKNNTDNNHLHTDFANKRSCLSSSSAAS